ncbi:MAG: ATP-binding cassette domain-containing protein [Alphaproteobacteria bacterium]
MARTDPQARPLSTSPLLVVDEVSKHFGALRAVDGVSFDVAAGEIFGIAGPNGSGKSTLFNLMTRIPFGPDGGSVRFDGRAIQSLPAHRIAQLGIARTFQKETRFESLSAWDNVLIGANYGLDAKGDAPEDVVVPALTQAGVPEDEWDRPSGELSVFHTKLLMLASALAMAPRVLMLDEPASGLTQPEVDQLRDVLMRLAQSGLTLVLIEHVLPLLLAVSQRLMVLNHGQVLIIGAPQDVVRDDRVIDAYLGSRRH